MQQNQNSEGLFAGGVIVVIVILGLSLKALEKIFKLLAKTFEAFGTMAESFVVMAWHGIIALGLIALGIGCVFAAVYFSYNYYQMVKSGLELKQQMESRMRDFVHQLGKDLDEHKLEVDESLKHFNDNLKKAIEKTTTVPPQTTTQQVIAPAANTSDVYSNPNHQESPQNVTNPF